MGIQIATKPSKWQVLILFLYCSRHVATKNLLYSVREEEKAGQVIGNVAIDLAIQVVAISERRVQLRSAKNGQYFSVDQKSGALTLTRRIDRESVCSSNLHCILTAEVVLEHPLELHRLEVEVVDINDNSPTFSNKEQVIEIIEFLGYAGARFPLEEAYDLDAGVNGVKHYNLSLNPYFSLSLRNQKDGAPSPELVIEKALDREERKSHQLTLTAFDGGDPPKSGVSEIIVIILDFNDNAPVFSQGSYQINLPENVPLNTIVVKLNVTDLDEGLNAEVEYFFDPRTPPSHKHLFSLNPITGVIRTNGLLDFESTKYYEITVRARDKGTPQMEGSCILQLEVGDVNDNLPEILLTSLLAQIPEDTNVGTTIGLFSVTDLDSGENGQVKVVMSPDVPFKIVSFKDHYALIVHEHLDRENTSQYKIILTAVDKGSPALTSQTEITVNISDVNDNQPVFLNQEFHTFIPENNEPEHLLYTVLACDPDEGSNAILKYSIVEKELFGLPISLLVSVNSVSGDIHAKRSFDYEQFHVLEITVQVEDFGHPALSSNTTIYVFIVDINDNIPSLLYPKYSGDLTSKLNLSKSVPVGYLVTKVLAVDPDSGHNAWISYKLLEPTSSSLFNLSTYSGEIRTIRTFLPTDESQQKLVLVISDSGKPSLSLTVTILVALDGNSEDVTHAFYNLFSANRTDITLYLIVSLVIISLASLITFIFVMVKCYKREMYLCQHPCWFLHQSNSGHCLQNQQPTVCFNMDGTLKYMEIRMDPANPDSRRYRTYFSHIDNMNLTLLKPFQFPPVVSDTQTLGVRDPNEQTQPNADWQLTQGQRPGPSGTQQPTEESGVWPNNQFETERLQAMILASANEAAEGSSGIGGSTGTMGLSARYGPQFTLQHVPDYRQNIYIPGTTTTLTNAAGKRDGKAPSGNKKKGKKEKK